MNEATIYYFAKKIVPDTACGHLSIDSTWYRATPRIQVCMLPKPQPGTRSLSLRPSSTHIGEVVI